MAQGNVAGGGAVGAVAGGLMGAVIGWLLGAQMTDIPVIGPLTGSGVLASVIGGLVVGAGVGALIGALIGSLSPQDAAPVEAIVEAAPEVAEDTALAVAAPGPGDEDLSGVPVVAAASADYDGPDSASDVPAAAAISPAGGTEESTMNDDNEQESGRNPSSFTGTEDAIDPGTGALGTAGTPLTTGHGVSGSTVGTGSESGEAAQRGSGEFRGATPDTKSYEMGGRGSGDSDVLEGDERALPAETRYSGTPADEAPAQSGREADDIYQAMPGYGEGVEGGDVGEAVPEGTGTTGVDANPPQESAGTNLPGTADPRGLGDNTEDTR